MKPAATLPAGVLACARPRCPAAAIGQSINVAFTTPERRAFTGCATAAGIVRAITPVLHGLLIGGPSGDLIVGGHGSTDGVEVR